MYNPYHSPPTLAPQTPAGRPITDEVVRKLIEGNQANDLAAYDVSDVLLFGWWYKRHLIGSLAGEAESAGCKPVVFQSVLWFCLVFMPVALGNLFRHAVFGTRRSRRRCGAVSIDSGEMGLPTGRMSILIYGGSVLDCWIRNMVRMPLKPLIVEKPPNVER